MKLSRRKLFGGMVALPLLPVVAMTAGRPQRRPGTKFIRNLRPGERQIPIQFSETEPYYIRISEQLLKR